MNEKKNLYFFIFKSTFPEKVLEFGNSESIKLDSYNNILLASTNPLANFISLFSSTMPSHHRIWDENSQLGIHVDFLNKILEENGYMTEFLGLEKDKVLVNLLKPKHHVLKNNDMDLISHFLAKREISHECNELQENRNQMKMVLIDHLIPSQIPEFKKCLLSLMKNERAEIVASSFSFQKNKGDGNSSQGYNSSSFPSLKEIKTKLFIMHSFKSNIQAQHDFPISLVDIIPGILSERKIKIPYTYIGKEISCTWDKGHRKEKKDSKIQRNFRLFELENGNKILISPKYKFSVQMDGDAGQLFDNEKDPLEHSNLWDSTDYQEVKSELLLQMMWAQLQKESIPMPRIAGA